MKRILCLLLLCLPLLLPSSARAQNTIAVSAASIMGLSGTPLASGALCFQATDSNNNPIAFQQGGGGAVITTPFCQSVFNGAVVTFNVSNPANTSPLNIRYHVTVVQGSRTVLDSPGVFLCNQSGSCSSPYTFNFDNCFSSGACNASPIPLTIGPPGLPCTSFLGAYSGATTYSAGTCVSSSGTIYFSLVGSNLNNTPASSPSYWTAVGNGVGGGNVSASGSPSQYQIAAWVSGLTIKGIAPSANGQCFMSAPSSYATSYPSFQSCPGGGTPSFPLTVAGTVNSGGIPCFNSTTNEESSAALGVNTVVLGGGAGACVSSSSALPNGTTATTQANGDDTGDVATDRFVLNNTAPTGPRVFYATAYGVKADAQFSCVAAFTNGNKTVTTDSGARTITNTASTTTVLTYTAANSFKPGYLVTVTGTTNGSGIFNVTNLPVATANSTTFTVLLSNAGFSSSSDSGTAQGPPVDPPFDAVLDATDYYFITNGPCAGSFGSNAGTLEGHGQFTSINNAHSAQMANNASATCTGSEVTGTSCVLVWARHDDTADLLAWFQDVTGGSGGISLCGTGVLPAGNMYFSSPIVNASTYCGSTSALAANMPVNAYSIVGQGIGQTVLIPAPTLDAAGAVGSFPAILFGTNAVQANNLANFSIFGGANNAITNGSGGKCVLSVYPLGSTQNVAVIDWGNNGIGPTALCQSGSIEGPSYISNFLSYNGGTTCVGLSNYVSAFGVQCFTYEGSTFGVGDIITQGSMWGNGSGGTAIQLESNTLAWRSTNDEIYPGGGGGFNQYCIEGASSTVKIYLVNTHCNAGGYMGVGGGIKLAGDSLFITNLHIDASTYGGPPISSGASGSKVFDGGGNNIIYGTNGNGTTNITYFGQASATGTALANTNWSVPAGTSSGQWGTSPSVGTCSGATVWEQCTITVGSVLSGANPILTVTFPTPFLGPPAWCNALQVGGTESINTFTTGTITAATAAFTYGATPIASDTLIVQVTCGNP